MNPASTGTALVLESANSIVAIKSCNGVIVPIDFDYFSRRNVYLPSAHYGHYVIHKKKDT